MNKWLKQLLAIAIIASSFTLSVQAADTSYTVLLDGRSTKLASQAFASGQVLYIDARTAFEEDGFSYTFVDKTLTADRSGVRIMITIGNKHALVNETTVTLSNGLLQRDGKLYLSIHDFASLTDKQYTKSVNGSTYYLKSNLKDQIAYLLTAKTNKARYEGDTSGGKKSGKGKLYINDILLYEGSFSNDMMNGLGKLYLNGSLAYVGGFVNNMPHGYGTYYFRSERYEGDFVEGKMQGIGKLYRDQLLLYDGEWVNNKMSGAGSLYDGQGQMVYEGDIRNEIRDGYGILYRNGKKFYQGGWSNGQYHGKGLLFDEQGTLSAIGNFTNHIMTGAGTSVTFGKSTWYTENDDGSYGSGELVDTAYMTRGTFVDGIMVRKSELLAYVGDFDDNKVPSGQGSIFLKKGYDSTTVGVLSDSELIYEGDVKDGVRHGTGQAYASEKMIYDGEYVNDQRSGKGREYAKGLLIYDGQWAADFRNGEGRSFEYAGDVSNYTGTGKVIIREGYYMGGNLRDTRRMYRYEGDLLEGKMTGFGFIYSLVPDSSTSPYQQYGSLHFSGIFVDGRREGEGREFSSGSLVFRGNYKNDMKHGFGTMYSGGKTVFEGNFVEDKKDGQGKLYDKDRVVYDGIFKDNMKNGFGKLYEDGWLVYEGNFKDDKKHGPGKLYRYSTLIFEGEFVNDKRADGK